MLKSVDLSISKNTTQINKLRKNTRHIYKNINIKVFFVFLPNYYHPKRKQVVNLIDYLFFFFMTLRSRPFLTVVN